MAQLLGPALAYQLHCYIAEHLLEADPLNAMEAALEAFKCARTLNRPDLMAYADNLFRASMAIDTVCIEVINVA